MRVSGGPAARVAATLEGMGTQDGWALVGQVVRERRDRLGLSQHDLAARGGPGSATVRKIERAAQDSFPTRTQAKLEQSLGWPPGTVARLLTAHAGDQWTSDADRREFIDALVRGDRPAAPAPAAVTGPVAKAADLSDEELLAELTYRMKRYADRA